ncbi:MAG: hypothetical protein OEO19_04400 [Gammaproteobacteria bacterium]|nr:hypothetical protein [Gammaproteobacteria bacterium]MDH3449675.1 hypothetical protein [Gammaproteobacteria bacterium]
MKANAGSIAKMRRRYQPYARMKAEMRLAIKIRQCWNMQLRSTRGYQEIRSKSGNGTGRGLPLGFEFSGLAREKARVDPGFPGCDRREPG